MFKYLRRILLCLALCCQTNISTFASEDPMEHVLDSHEWHITTIKKHPLTIPLPVILISKDRGIESFMSNKFYDELHNPISHQGYILKHGKIIPEDNTRKVYDFSITKNLTAMLVSLIILFGILLTVGRWYKEHSYRDTPKGLVAVMEMLIIYIRDEIAVPNIGKEKSEKFTPYLLTIFFFIWLNNMLGLLPGSANVTGCASIALCLAVFTSFTMLLNGSKHFWHHLFMPPVPKPLWVLMVPIEILELFTKPITLMLRLVANISSGHLIILNIINFAFIFKNGAVGFGAACMGAFMFILKLIVCFLQAYVFTLLSSIYIGDAVK